MVAVVDTVECVVCFKTHLEVPPEREGLNLDGVMVTGVWPADYSYYRDNYLKEGYSVICRKAHDKLLAPKLVKLES